MNESEISHLLLMDPETLTEVLGEQLYPDLSERGVISGLLQRTHEWLAIHQQEMRATVCGHRDMLVGNDILVISAIADLIADRLDMPPALTLATLISKRGIEAFCKGADL